MENHHFLAGKIDYKSPFSIAFCMFTRAEGTPMIFQPLPKVRDIVASGNGQSLKVPKRKN